MQELATDAPMCLRPYRQYRGDIVVDGFFGSLTTEVRMLLHLYDHVMPEGEWEAPLSLTQAGISAAVHVQRKHVPRTLKRLETMGCLIKSKRHIPGAKQRRIVYCLTQQGRNRASELRNEILSREVEKEDSMIVLSELRKGGQLTLDLLSHIDEAMVYHENPVVSPVSNPDGVASLDAQAGEQLVRRLFARAWEDGKITKDEQQLLSEVVEFLGMHPERVRRLSDESRRSQKAPPPEEIYLDMLKQALVDGLLVEDEVALLETVRVAFGIDQLTHQKLLQRAIDEPELPQNIATYQATLKTALADGIITSDEDAMLQTLRDTLNITPSQHAEILAELRDSIK
jgi:DNA-binding MarR family transcriptional regulator